jgi:Sigma-70, region 4
LFRDKNMRDELSELLEVLDDRERKIIFKRFGLDGGKPETLEEIGKKFGVTRERIRQLQNIALVKLRRALAKREKPIVGSRPSSIPQTRLSRSHSPTRSLDVCLDRALNVESITAPSGGARCAKQSKKAWGPATC